VNVYPLIEAENAGSGHVKRACELHVGLVGSQIRRHFLNDLGTWMALVPFRVRLASRADRCYAP
jgi:hypothetical protein